jgi:ABC-type sugar transport system ATPase subunit
LVLPASCAGGKLGIRPEHIELAFERGARAVVDSVEYLGGDSLVGCRIGGQPLQVRVPGSVGITRGDATWLSWAPGAQHFFEPGGTRVAAPDRHQPATMLA